MKLKIKEFEALAKQNGYRNGKALMKKLGAGKCAYGCLKRGCKIGYKKDPNDKEKWLIDDDAAQIVRKIFRMYLDGTTWAVLLAN